MNSSSNDDAAAALRRRKAEETFARPPGPRMYGDYMLSLPSAWGPLAKLTHNDVTKRTNFAAFMPHSGTDVVGIERSRTEKIREELAAKHPNESRQMINLMVYAEERRLEAADKAEQQRLVGALKERKRKQDQKKIDAIRLPRFFDKDGNEVPIGSTAARAWMQENAPDVFQKWSSMMREAHHTQQRMNVQRSHAKQVEKQQTTAAKAAEKARQREESLRELHQTQAEEREDKARADAARLEKARRANAENVQRKREATQAEMEQREEHASAQRERIEREREEAVLQKQRREELAQLEIEARRRQAEREAELAAWQKRQVWAETADRGEAIRSARDAATASIAAEKSAERERRLEEARERKAREVAEKREAVLQDLVTKEQKAERAREKREQEHHEYCLRVEQRLAESEDRYIKTLEQTAAKKREMRQKTEEAVYHSRVARLEGLYAHTMDRTAANTARVDRAAQLRAEAEAKTERERKQKMLREATPAAAAGPSVPILAVDQPSGAASTVGRRVSMAQEDQPVFQEHAQTSRGAPAAKKTSPWRQRTPSMRPTPSVTPRLAHDSAHDGPAGDGDDAKGSPAGGSVAAMLRESAERRAALMKQIERRQYESQLRREEAEAAERARLQARQKQWGQTVARGHDKFATKQEKHEEKNKALMEKPKPKHFDPPKSLMAWAPKMLDPHARPAPPADIPFSAPSPRAERHKSPKPAGADHLADQQQHHQHHHPRTLSPVQAPSSRGRTGGGLNATLTSQPRSGGTASPHFVSGAGAASPQAEAARLKAQAAKEKRAEELQKSLAKAESVEARRAEQLRERERELHREAKQRFQRQSQLHDEQQQRRLAQAEAKVERKLEATAQSAQKRQEQLAAQQARLAAQLDAKHEAAMRQKKQHEQDKETLAARLKDRELQTKGKLRAVYDADDERFAVDDAAIVAAAHRDDPALFNGTLGGLSGSADDNNDRFDPEATMPPM